MKTEREIQQIFNRVFNGEKNFITPFPVRYAQAGSYFYELAKSDAGVYGVTVLEATTHKKRHDLSNCFDSVKEATNHIEWLKTLDETDRARVNSAIEFGAMSTGVAVSEKFVEEMRDCLPPQFMGHVYPFNYIQVGEVSEHRKDHKTGEYVPVYETYCCVSEEGKNSPLATAYDFGQWYFIGLKPELNNKN
jgi:hypothetical protein